MRRVVVAVILVLGGSAPTAAGQVAPPKLDAKAEGERVYKQRCARCHEGTMPRMPSRDALRQYTPEAIDTSLSSFAMRRQGSALSAAERRAVAEFLSGRPSGSYRAPLDVIAKRAYCNAGAPGGQDFLTGPVWNGWGADLQNTRFQSAEAAGLSRGNSARTKLYGLRLSSRSRSASEITSYGGHTRSPSSPATRSS